MSLTRKNASQMAEEIISMNLAAFGQIPSEDLKKLASNEYLQYRDNNIKLDLYVAQQILHHASPVDRAKEMEYWIQVMDQCYQKKDYAGFIGLLGALNSTPVNRLAVTATFLSAGAKDRFEELKKKGNFRSLQTEIEEACNKGEVVAPYLAMYKDKLERTGQTKFLAEADAGANKSKLDFQAKSVAQQQLMSMFSRMQENIPQPSKIQLELKTTLDKIDLSQGSDKFRRGLEENSKTLEPRVALDEINKIDGLMKDLEVKMGRKTGIKAIELKNALENIKNFQTGKKDLKGLLAILGSYGDKFKGGLFSKTSGTKDILDGLIKSFNALLTITSNQRIMSAPWTVQSKLASSSKILQSISIDPVLLTNPNQASVTARISSTSSKDNVEQPSSPLSSTSHSLRKSSAEEEPAPNAEDKIHGPGKH